jgi:hypothetical protein
MKGMNRVLIHNYGSSDTATAFRGSLQNGISAYSVLFKMQVSKIRLLGIG